MLKYVFQGFGVFLGVITGVGLLLLKDWIMEKRSEARKIKSVKFELEFNIKKISKWLEDLNEYRNAVNADNPGLFFGYFDLSRIIYVATNDMFFSGLLYKHLSHDDIGKLQVIASEFSIYGENYLANQINQNKANFNKTNAIQDIMFWDKKFKEHKKTLEDILNKLA